VKTIPILFSTDMVRALLDGRKTQTRREIVPQPYEYDGAFMWKGVLYGAITDSHGTLGSASRYGIDGDLLLVRESIYVDHVDVADGGRLPEEPTFEYIDNLYYRADGECCQQIPECQCFEVGKPKWTPSIYMPRWACRLVLRRVGPVRVERLLHISDADARAEGVDTAGLEAGPQTAAQTAYFNLWNKINGPESSVANPWVWVIPFEVAAKNLTEAQMMIGGVA